METDENSIVNTGSDQQRNAIIKIIEQSSDAEKIALANWAEDLLFIKVSELSKIEKGRQAIALTAKAKVIIPALKGLAKDIRLDQIDGAKNKFF